MNNTRLFFYLTAGFVVATVAGTQLHELGHYTMAKLLGYEPILRYGSVSFTDASWEALTEADDYLIRLAGPLQTMLTGTIGLILLLIYRKALLSATRLSFGQWVLIFLAFFWSRQVFNLLIWLGNIVTGTITYRMDEVRTAMYLDLPFWLIIAVTGIIGMLVLAFVVFRFIPNRQRLTFIAAGFSGGITGFILWFYFLGPILLP